MVHNIPPIDQIVLAYLESGGAISKVSMGRRGISKSEMRARLRGTYEQPQVQ